MNVQINKFNPCGSIFFPNDPMFFSLPPLNILEEMVHYLPTYSLGITAEFVGDAFKKVADGELKSRFCGCLTLHHLDLKKEQSETQEKRCNVITRLASHCIKLTFHYENMTKEEASEPQKQMDACTREIVELGKSFINLKIAPKEEPEMVDNPDIDDIFEDTHQSWRELNRQCNREKLKALHTTMTEEDVRECRKQIDECNLEIAKLDDQLKNIVSQLANIGIEREDDFDKNTFCDLIIYDIFGGQGFYENVPVFNDNDSIGMPTIDTMTYPVMRAPKDDSGGEAIYINWRNDVTGQEYLEKIYFYPQESREIICTAENSEDKLSFQECGCAQGIPLSFGRTGVTLYETYGQVDKDAIIFLKKLLTERSVLGKEGFPSVSLAKPKSNSQSVSPPEYFHPPYINNPLELVNELEKNLQNLFIKSGYTYPQL